MNEQIIRHEGCGPIVEHAITRAMDVLGTLIQLAIVILMTWGVAILIMWISPPCGQRPIFSFVRDAWEWTWSWFK